MEGDGDERHHQRGSDELVAAQKRLEEQGGGDGERQRPLGAVGRPLGVAGRPLGVAGSRAGGPRQHRGRGQERQIERARGPEQVRTEQGQPLREQRSQERGHRRPEPQVRVDPDDDECDRERRTDSGNETEGEEGRCRLQGEEAVENRHRDPLPPDLRTVSNIGTVTRILLAQVRGVLVQRAVGTYRGRIVPPQERRVRKDSRLSGSGEPPHQQALGADAVRREVHGIRALRQVGEKVRREHRRRDDAQHPCAPARPPPIHPSDGHRGSAYDGTWNRRSRPDAASSPIEVTPHSAIAFSSSSRRSESTR